MLQDAPRDPVGRAVVYRFDKVETLDGEALENVTILVRNGVIERMGKAVVIPEHATMHDYRGSGKIAMPPFALSHANFLVRDRRGSGRNAKYRAVDSLWLEEGWEKDLLKEGVVLVGVDPPGRGVPGRTSVLRVDGQVETPDPLVADLHLKITVSNSSSAKRLIRDSLAVADKAIEKENQARKDWEKARADWEAKQKEKAEEEKKKEQTEDGTIPPAVAQGEDEQKDKDGQEQAPPEEFTPPPVDPNIAPFVEWIRQQRVAQVWLSSGADWLHWQDLLGERELPYEIVLWHGTSQNIYQVADAIAATELRVDVPARISFLPYTRVRANLPAELAKAGVSKMILSPSSDSWSAVKSYRFAVAEVVANGLDRQMALRGMSLEPAMSMGQEEVLGPLKVGSPATFVIWNGDPLNPMSQADRVLVDGVVVYDRAKAEAEDQS